MGVLTGSIVARRSSALNTAIARSSARSVKYEPFSERLRDQMGARARADLGHRVARMRAHRVVRDAQLLGDLRSSAPERDEPHDLTLASRERSGFLLGTHRPPEAWSPPRGAHRHE